MALTVLTWLWRQNRSRFVYTADHVNIWAKAVRANTSMDIELACVTDVPEGIDSSIRIIPLPQEFDYQVAQWRIDRGLPQCFRRVSMFSPKAADTFGERFVSMDLDAVILSNLDHVFGCKDDFRMLKGGSGSRPYNGSLLIMTAGARSQVYTKFTPKAAEKACAKYVGSDQAWISYCLGWGEKIFTRDEHGIYFLSRGVFRRAIPGKVKLAFFPGEPKFFMNGECHRALKTEVDIMNRLYGRELWDRSKAAEAPADMVIRIPRKKKKALKIRRYNMNRMR